MQRTRVRVGSHLTALLDELPTGLTDDLREFLTVVDEDRRRAVEQGDHQAQFRPESVVMYSEHNGEIHVPRGVADTLGAALVAEGHEVDWIDETLSPYLSLSVLAGMKPISLRKHQITPVDVLTSRRQGVLSSATGTGKTVICLEVARRLGLGTTILLDKTDLAKQWRTRAMQHLGLPEYRIGMIGEGKFTIGAVTIAMVPSLRRLDGQQLRALVESTGLLIVDECHHIVAETWRQAVSSFCPYGLIGVTATPLQHDWRRPLLQSYIGPILHTTTADEATGLIKPRVEVISTDFRVQVKHIQDSRDRYRAITDAIVDDAQRLDLIASRILREPRNAHLVVSKRLAQLDALEALLIARGWSPSLLMRMTGKENARQREELLNLAGVADGLCILATVAGEGVDIPRLDRLHRIWPMRRALSVTQEVGRITRAAPGKTDAVVIDYCDKEMGVLMNQFRQRRAQVYVPAGYEITYR